MRTYGRRSTRKELPRELSIACPRQNDHDRTVSSQHRHRSGGHHDRPPVHYTCADGTKLQATFSPLSTLMGSVKLVFAGSSTEMTLPQALSADGGRYTEGDIEFWIKGKGATLTRAGKSTTCRTGD